MEEEHCSLKFASRSNTWHSRKMGFKRPRPIAVNSIELLPKAAEKLNQFPFIIKPNRGGKGKGVQLINDVESLERLVASQQVGESLDGIWLVQEYIRPTAGHIVRVEFIGGQFYYAVKVDASNGFELCPADACQIDDAFCPALGAGLKNKFEIEEYYHNDDLDKYRNFFQENDIQVGALEYVTDETGRRYVYDVNTNTNYNSEAESRTRNQLSAMRRVADFLAMELVLQEPLAA